MDRQAKKKNRQRRRKYKKKFFSGYKTPELHAKLKGTLKIIASKTNINEFLPEGY